MIKYYIIDKDGVKRDITFYINIYGLLPVKFIKDNIYKNYKIIGVCVGGGK